MLSSSGGRVRSAIVLLLLTGAALIARADEVPRCFYESTDACRFDVEQAERGSLNVEVPEGRRLSVSVEQASVSMAALNAEYWGVPEQTSEKPVTVIDSMVVELDGESLQLPASAISGLATVNDISIYGHEDWFNIDLHGGDASTSYMVSLHFVGDDLAWRRVKHREFPDVVWEATTYSSF